MAAFCYVAYLEEVEAEREKLARQAAEERELDERAAAASGGEEEEEEERASVAGSEQDACIDIVAKHLLVLMVPVRVIEMKI